MNPPTQVETDPVTKAMNDLYALAGPDVTYPPDQYRDLSRFLATEFRAKLQAAERAIADLLPPVPYTPFGAAMSRDGYVEMVYGVRRLGRAGGE